MDYQAWVERAKQFIGDFRRSHPTMKAGAEFGPPATPERIAEVEAVIGRPLHRQYRAFLLTASGDCDFRYWWKPTTEAQAEASKSAFDTVDIPGGLESFANLAYMERDFPITRELAEGEAWGDEPFCRNPLPIGIIGNGDEIAIDLDSDVVVYLAHDDVSYVLARDFDSFLASWEAICFLDPGLTLPFDRFVDKEGGGINSSDRPDLRRLREILLPGGATWTASSPG